MAIRPPSLPQDEIELLRRMGRRAMHGADIEPSVLFRLALYDLVREEDDGWRLTDNGRQALRDVSSRANALAAAGDLHQDRT